MSNTLTEGLYLGDWLKYEEPNLFSRDQITVLAGEALTTGMVLGKITASGKFVQLDLDASDGSQNAAGIAVAAVTAESGVDQESVAIVRDAIVNAAKLVWPDGASAGDITTGTAALKALGILAREGA